MKTKRLVIISLIALFAGVCAVQAKKPRSTMDILTSTVWEHDCGKHSDAIGDGIFFTFGEKTGRQIIYYKGMKMMDASFTYYLSQKPQTEYNKKKEGKVKKGKYITIVYTSFGENSPMTKMLLEKGANLDEPGPPSSHEIIGLTPGEFSLPSVGVDGTFVPCPDLEAAERRLAAIYVKLKEQSTHKTAPKPKQGK